MAEIGSVPTLDGSGSKTPMRQRKNIATIILVAVSLAEGAQKAVPLTPSAEPPVRTQTLESAYNQHIVPLLNDVNVIVFLPNGDIIHRGGRVSNDQEIVLALQELHSLLVQNSSMISNRLCNKTEGRAEESHLTRTALTFTALYVHAHSIGPGSLFL